MGRGGSWEWALFSLHEKSADISVIHRRGDVCTRNMLAFGRREDLQEIILL